MRVRILGSAAGGGFPQWNCGCRQCVGVREEGTRASPRTQTSAAVSVDGDEWFLLAASPDVRVQLAAAPPLWPRGRRDTPIAGILLPNGDLDACLGLFSLRESQPLRVWATDAVRTGLVANPMLRTLQRFTGQLAWHLLEPARTVRLGADIEAEIVAVPGKIPTHLEGTTPSPEDNVGFILRRRRGGPSVGWFPCVGAPSAELLSAIDRVDVLYFDGTFWSADELIERGLGTQRAQDMAHWPLGGPEGSLRALRRSRARRRFLVHVNNTNPILHEGSEQWVEVNRAGVQVAYDGMEDTW